MDHERLHITVFNGPLKVTHRSVFNGSQERLPIPKEIRISFGGARACCGSFPSYNKCIFKIQAI